MNNVSINRVEVSGNLCADARISESKNFAGFDLAHNAGKDKEALFDKVKMFNKNGKADVNIPFDILKKGRRVLVSGYRVTVEEEYQGKTLKKEYIIALEVKDYPKSEENPSVNRVEISGNLCADANASETKNFAGFDIAHNAGKNNPVLFDKVKMFNKNGKNAVEIPFADLVKGTRILVSGYRRTEKDEYQKDGQAVTSKKTVIIALNAKAYPWDGQGEETVEEDMPATE